MANLFFLPFFFFHSFFPNSLLSTILPLAWGIGQAVHVIEQTRHFCLRRNNKNYIHWLDYFFIFLLLLLQSPITKFLLLITCFSILVPFAKAAHQLLLPFFSSPNPPIIPFFFFFFFFFLLSSIVNKGVGQNQGVK